MTTHKGRCLCGAVTLTATNVETEHHACHCGMCRRWVGGPMFAALAESVTFEGAEHIGRYKSSDWAERGFCKQCGSSLFYYFVPANQYMLAVGCIDDAESFELARELFVDHQRGRYAFSGQHERLTEEQTIAHFSGGAE